MNRRNFLGALVGGVATAAAVRTWPFRVYSFPKGIAVFDHELEYRTVTGWMPLQNTPRACRLENIRTELPCLTNGVPNAAWLKAFGEFKV